MERLTKRIGDYVYYTQGEYEETLPIEMETGDVRNALKKLAYYEDLEEKLEKAYGECEGLLETVVFDLVKHEGVEIGTPHKARLLTDEDVDKWEGFKNAEEQGLLLGLPCKVGDTLWWVDAFGDLCSSAVNSMFVEQGIDGIVIETWVCNVNGKEIGKTAFLTKEEAEQALAKMEKENE